MTRKSEPAGAVRCRTAQATILALLASLALTAWPQQTPTDLTSKSIEELMNIRVTSVSKTEQALSRAASAIFVITPDAIRRSGATNIPDLLRMVPGLDVARSDANSWAVSARGFNGKFSDTLLVLHKREVLCPLRREQVTQAPAVGLSVGSSRSNGASARARSRLF